MRRIWLEEKCSLRATAERRCLAYESRGMAQADAGPQSTGRQNTMPLCYLSKLVGAHLCSTLKGNHRAVSQFQQPQRHITTRTTTRCGKAQMHGSEHSEQPDLALKNSKLALFPCYAQQLGTAMGKPSHLPPLSTSSARPSTS